MLRSMTGFGRGVHESASGRVVVEVRSVNHRFLDVVARLPRELAEVESAVIREVKGRLRRGRVEVHVEVSEGDSGSQVRVDADLYRQLVEAMAGLSGLDVDDPELRRLALQQPGVIALGPQAGGQRSLPAEVIQAAAAQAVGRLVEMREREGQELGRVIADALGALEREVAAVSEATADLTASLHQRLAERMRILVGQGVDDVRLLQEAGLMADKADVAEELDRLRSHLAQMNEAIGGEEPVGRRLEFLLQEAHREVNTLGSKVGEPQVRARVVEMKSILERLREQAANVE